MWLFTDQEKSLIRSLLEKGKIEQEKNKKFAIIDFDVFCRLFTPKEVTMFKKYLAIDPQKIGYKLPFIGMGQNTDNLVAIEGQLFLDANGEKKNIPCQYLPPETYEAYIQLNKALEGDISKKLLIQYGHRSLARQVFIFFDILERIYDFDFDQTIKRVCFPDYSEHVCMKQQAIDFKTEDGVKSEDFYQTKEYEWLKKNAMKFGFYESYPKDNIMDMMYEPWHWHHES